MSDRVEWVFEGGLDDGITSATVVFETVSNSSHRSRQRKARERHHQLTENEGYNNSYYGVHGGNELSGHSQGHDSPLSIPHSGSRKPGGSNASVSASSRSSRSRRRRQQQFGGSGKNSPSSNSWVHGKAHQKRRSRTDRLENEINIAAVSGVYSSGACLPVYHSNSNTNASHGQRTRGEHHLHEVLFTDEIDYEVDLDDAIVQLCLGSVSCGSNRGGTQTTYFEVECEDDSSFAQYGHGSLHNEKDSYYHGTEYCRDYQGLGQSYEMISNTRGGRGNAYMSGRGLSYRGGPGKTRALAIKSPFASGKGSGRSSAAAPYTKVSSSGAAAASHYGSSAAAMWAEAGPSAISRNKKLNKKKIIGALPPASAMDTLTGTHPVPQSWNTVSDLAAPPSLPPLAQMRFQADGVHNVAGPNALSGHMSATLHPARTPPLAKASLSPLPSPSFMPHMNLLPPSQLSMCSNGAAGDINEYFRL